MDFHKLTAKLIPHDNRLTVSPPGKLKARSNYNSIPHVIVASKRRSGTHLLIDTLLNNFEPFRRTPLYVNLDSYVVSGHTIESLNESGPYVIKTHYPQSTDPRIADALEMLISSGSKVIITDRKDSEILKSLEVFLPSLDENAARKSNHEFDIFWKDQDYLRIKFEDIINTFSYTEVVNSISDYLNIKHNESIIFPPGRSELIKAMASKLLTRTLGRHAPVINTTIAFNKKAK
ncbi:hypothetical protein [Pseudazoarcus pumilus]|uniref:hypothetical protein n=1 Tax=Pseudazoarcus pumilus TaxID=2067960 RepID=UPI000F4E9023|nr:hypothetical protein [Pseudazoarcus pumilus]